jgi:hypothetical protein
VNWLTIHCPGCRGRFRLKEAYAHLRGRCPHCGFRIEAQRPKPLKPQAPQLENDSLALAPIDEEWPEPAETGEANQPANYALSEAPVRVNEPPRVERKPSVEGYGLGNDWKPTPSAAPEPVHDAYDVGPAAEPARSKEEPIIHGLSMAERNPLRAPPPPANPLWQGVFDIPWQPGNLRTWTLLTFVLGVFLVFLVLFGVLFGLFQTASGLSANTVISGYLIPPTIAILAILVLVVGAMTASRFLAVFEQTAAGNHDVHWPDESIGERFLKFVYLLWLTGAATLPSALLCYVLAGVVTPGWFLVLLGLVPALVFPILLLSSQAARKTTTLLDRNVLRRLAVRPGALWTFYLQSSFVLGISVLLGMWTIVDQLAWLVPVAAVVWSAALMVYARMLGRLAWVITRKKT